MKEDSFKNAWNKLWSTEETERSGSEEQQSNEFTDLFQSVSGFEDCDEQDANEWLQSDDDPGFQSLNEDETIKCVLETSDATDNEMDADGGDGDDNEGPTHAEGFAALEVAMMWYERQPEYCCTQLLLLKGIRDLATRKRRSMFKQ